MIYSKIVVAYDGSEISEKALDSAIKLAKLNHFSNLEIIHVIHIPKYVVGEAVYIPPVEINTDYSDHIVAQIQQSLLNLTNTHIEIRQGSPAQTILDYAEEVSADLIVIGSRGLNAISEFILGSVSHNVVQHAKIPVLVVK
ncbi:Nucleotide-binding universal stress protein, UspA family [Paenibacillus sp. 1_12]|uniref:universal stress protein n=1 Tax=Paenibacillus sp. 1_12 TaxID=1566278 RepID=UPI0008EE057F|nr:universal stress protein [Paenibacillus sp. 1_12]SFK98248.1 Nucleotide-binding universal stress protein, UspA family [Paenibacillus sp. 1_12]